MSGRLGLAVTLGCLVAAVVILAHLALRRFRWRAVLPAVAIAELVVVGQAVLHVYRLVAGYRPAEPATHLGYLLASLIVLPLAASQARDDGRWSALLLCGGFVVEAVVLVRLQATWWPAHA